MSTIVNMKVTGIDIDDEDTMEMVEDRIEGVAFAARRGTVMLTVFVEKGKDVVHAATDAAFQLTSIVPEAKVEGVDPELVNTSDIAARVGLSREAVRKWAARNDRGFPPPFGTTGVDKKTQKIWRWYEVSEWLINVLGIDLDEHLPTVAEVARIDACLAGVPDVYSQAWKAHSQDRSLTVKVKSRQVHQIWIHKDSTFAAADSGMGQTGLDNEKMGNWETSSA